MLRNWQKSRKRKNSRRLSVNRWTSSLAPDGVRLCSSLLHANADYGYWEALVKHADCLAERKADALQYIIDARAGYG